MFVATSLVNNLNTSGVKIEVTVNEDAIDRKKELLKSHSFEISEIDEINESHNNTAKIKFSTDPSDDYEVRNLVKTHMSAKRQQALFIEESIASCFDNSLIKSESDEKMQITTAGAMSTKATPDATSHAEKRRNCIQL